MTRLRKSVLIVAMMGLFGLFGANALAAVVTFDNFNDTNEGFFDGATVDPVDGNTLVIGLADFIADGSAVETASAFDTFAVTITAPTGYRITGINYNESGTFTPMGGTVNAGGSIVVDGEAMGFNDIHSGNATGGWFLDPSFSLDTVSAVVSITNVLFAFGPGATISKDMATLSVELVELTAVPLPASIMLMGSALAGLLLVQRRREPDLFS